MAVIKPQLEEKARGLVAVGLDMAKDEIDGNKPCWKEDVVIPKTTLYWVAPLSAVKDIAAKYPHVAKTLGITMNDAV